MKAMISTALKSFSIPGGEAEEPEVLPTQASPYAVYGWYFEKTVQKWAQGGLTKMEQADGALVITAAKDGRPRVWTSNKTDGVTQNPINLKTEDATHAAFTDPYRYGISEIRAAC